MNQILALREKRANLWEAAKKYRDAHIGSDGTMSAEDAATYDRMVDDVDRIRTAQDKPPYFAVGFKSEKSNGKFRFVWLFKVRAKPLTENFATKEGDTVTRQNPEVEFTAIKRTHDGRYQAVADEGENGFTAEKGAAFLSTVYEPAIVKA